MDNYRLLILSSEGLAYEGMKATQYRICQRLAGAGIKVRVFGGHKIALWFAQRSAAQGAVNQGSVLTNSWEFTAWNKPELGY